MWTRQAWPLVRGVGRSGAVVMVSVQPTYGDKAYWSSRVLAPNDSGLWQMMESYHNYILASPVMTATPNQHDLK